MKVTSTAFRKNLFQILERALQGELVEVAHKGRLIRLVPENKTGKLSRLIQRDTINGTLEDLERAQQQLDDELRDEARSYNDVACMPSAKGAATLDSAGRKSQADSSAAISSGATSKDAWSRCRAFPADRRPDCAQRGGRPASIGSPPL
jgi:antitoxin (DNA-binding transcriptional repressor) of toxin-antitoxin stability system